MKLQLALDELNLYDALKFTEPLVDHIDIVEIGTPFVIREGVKAITEFKKNFPSLEVFADLKIMDGGSFETELAIEAGADYITVLGVADMSTITNCIKTGNKFNKQIVVDMLCISDIEKSVQQLEEVKAHYIAVHTGVDQQKSGRTPLKDLQVMKQCAKYSKIAVAGGIDRDSISKYIDLNPDIIIVGSSITKASSPSDEASLLKSIINDRG